MEKNIARSMLSWSCRSTN